ncbi:MAG: PRC-barrel domain-containing protein [Acidobacteria bacterium]|nr:PRC-barrel domain-containing protein [Acidobacteriota bacterium]
MIGASEPGGRAVIDIEAAEKLGRLDAVVIDPAARRVVGLVVSRGGSIVNSPTRTVISASSMHAIGPDAVTVRLDRTQAVRDERADDLPRVSDFVGRTVVSRGGTRLGVVGDVLISGPDGRILGYELANPSVVAKLEALVGQKPDRPRLYLRADADLRTGRDLIVAPEDAVAHWNVEEDASGFRRDGAERGPQQQGSRP